MWKFQRKTRTFSCAANLFDMKGTASTSFMITAGLYSAGRSATPSLVVHPLANDLAPTNSATKGFSYQIF